MAFIIDSSGIPDNYSLRTFSKIASASLLPFSMAMSAITWRALLSGRQNPRGSILCVLDKVVLSLSMYFWTTWTKSQSLTSSQALTSRTSSLDRCGCSAWNLFIFCGSQTNATQTCAVSWNISVPFFLGIITNNLTSGNCPSLVKHDGKNSLTLSKNFAFMYHWLSNIEYFDFLIWTFQGVTLFPVPIVLGKITEVKLMQLKHALSLGT